MASTYSTSLKLELPANGDQSGTWGTTVNNNFGSLVEQAITGVQTITMTNVDKTLTSTNGSVDEARNAVLVVSGTNSTIRNVIAPAVKKLYVVVNNTTGGFSIIVKTSASAGVTIPNGAALWVYCDGTNFSIIAPYTAATTSTPIVFQGYASGTTLTVTSAPTLPITIGQTIFNPGIYYTTSGFPANTTITALGTGTGSTGTYTISNASTVGNVLYPQPIVALPVLNQIATVDYVQSKTQSPYFRGAPSADTATAAAFEGTVANGTTLILSKYYAAGNGIGLGQYITSSLISEGTYVSAWGTGTTGNATFTGFISGNTLTVTSGTVTGTITTSQYLQSAGTVLTSGTKITGGSGLSWTVNNSQTLGSATSLISFNAYGPITNSTVAATGTSGWVTVQNDLQALTTTVARSPMISYLAPLQLSNVLFSANIANLIGTLGTQSDEAVSIKGGTINGVTLSNLASALPVGSGGTGTTSITQNAVVVGNGTSTPTAIRPGAVNNALVSTVGATVTAGAFVVGTQYTILVVGTTDFTLIGASANTIGIIFTATGVGTGTGTATTNTWASSTTITPTSGTAPYYGARAFASFSSITLADISATYSQTSTTVTLTVASHTYQVGHQIYVDVTSGTGVDGLYVVTAVTTTTITYTAGTSLSTFGTAVIKQCSIYTGSQNVANVVYQATGTFVVNFTNAMPFSNYAVTASAGTNNSGTTQLGDDNYIAFSGGVGLRTTQSIRGFCIQPTSMGLENSSIISIVIFA